MKNRKKMVSILAGIMAFIMVVFPVPGPPVITITFS